MAGGGGGGLRVPDAQREVEQLAELCGSSSKIADQAGIEYYGG